MSPGVNGPTLSPSPILWPEALSQTVCPQKGPAGPL